MLTETVSVVESRRCMCSREGFLRSLFAWCKQKRGCCLIWQFASLHFLELHFPDGSTGSHSVGVPEVASIALLHNS